MKRALFAVAMLINLAALAAPPRAEAQPTSTAVTFGGWGTQTPAGWLGYGDSFPLYVTSDLPFTVVSVDLRSQLAVTNGIRLFGYSVAYVQQYNADYARGLHDQPFPRSMIWGNVGTPTYSAFVTVGRTFFETIMLDWRGLGGLLLDSTGGPDELGGYASNFLVGNVNLVVGTTTAPEPSTLLLLGSGLLGLFGVQRFVKRRGPA